jgi:hypothetical protein
MGPARRGLNSAIANSTVVVAPHLGLYSGVTARDRYTDPVCGEQIALRRIRAEVGGPDPHRCNERPTAAPHHIFSPGGPGSNLEDCLTQVIGGRPALLSGRMYTRLAPRLSSVEN